MYISAFRVKIKRKYEIYRSPCFLCHLITRMCQVWKISWFLNVFLLSSIHPKNEWKNVTLLLWYLMSNCFGSFFGRYEDTKKTFRNSLTFSLGSRVIYLLSCGLRNLTRHAQANAFAWTGFGISRVAQCLTNWN